MNAARSSVGNSGLAVGFELGWIDDPPGHPNLQSEVRRLAARRRRDVANHLALFHRLSVSEPARKPTEWTVAGLDAAAVADEDRLRFAGSTWPELDLAGAKRDHRHLGWGLILEEVPTALTLKYRLARLSWLAAATPQDRCFAQAAGDAVTAVGVVELTGSWRGPSVRWAALAAQKGAQPTCACATRSGHVLDGEQSTVAIESLTQILFLDENADAIASLSVVVKVQFAGKDLIDPRRQRGRFRGPLNCRQQVIFPIELISMRWVVTARGWVCLTGTKRSALPVCTRSR
jgi:hypothetical protein